MQRQKRKKKDENDIRQFFGAPPSPSCKRANIPTQVDWPEPGDYAPVQSNPNGDDENDGCRGGSISGNSGSSNVRRRTPAYAQATLLSDASIRPKEVLSLDLPPMYCRTKVALTPVEPANGESSLDDIEFTPREEDSSFDDRPGRRYRRLPGFSDPDTQPRRSTRANALFDVPANTHGEEVPTLVSKGGRDSRGRSGSQPTTMPPPPSEATFERSGTPLLHEDEEEDEDEEQDEKDEEDEEESMSLEFGGGTARECNNPEMTQSPGEDANEIVWSNASTTLPTLSDQNLRQMKLNYHHAVARVVSCREKLTIAEQALQELQEVYLQKVELRFLREDDLLPTAPN